MQHTFRKTCWLSNTCAIKGKSLKLTILLSCSIPPKWVPFNDPGVQPVTCPTSCIISAAEFMYSILVSKWTGNSSISSMMRARQYAALARSSMLSFGLGLWASKVCMTPPAQRSLAATASTRRSWLGSWSWPEAQEWSPTRTSPQSLPPWKVRSSLLDSLWAWFWRTLLLTPTPDSWHEVINSPLIWKRYLRFFSMSCFYAQNVQSQRPKPTI